MISSLAFQTKARTVDHLGREQIADTPTAISELWKNSFDAYARNVALDIFGGVEPVAMISDDGHGMNRIEFESRWLVVGTESKATNDITPPRDRSGLRLRPRQGQKGIGRLSCANLAPILLLVSKRETEPYVAALLDWRLFENPFANLADIRIPVTEFIAKEDLLGALPELIESLAQNVEGDGVDARSSRLVASWEAYDRLFLAENAENNAEKVTPPSKEILSTIRSISFEERHFAQWSLWAGEAAHGTALLMTKINYDLRVELEEGGADTTAKAARDRFFETLTSFVDPFVDPAETGSVASQVQFSYVVRAWDGPKRREIVGSEKQFDRRLLDDMEHLLHGTVDARGVFTGNVKAFGKWVTDTCIIEPPKDLVIPQRADTQVGPFDVFIASMEFVMANSSLPRQEFQRFQELALRYSGFMIFRDGLRVLPYGRTDNDFFEIESRRSKNAGREFWNHRQMFGRLAISRRINPNLKDKAGREGLLDNRAAKTLKELVSNILRQAARRYFGSDSTIRGAELPNIQKTNQAERIAVARNKLRQHRRKEFRTKLQTYSQELPRFSRELEIFAQSLLLKDEGDIGQAQQQLEVFRERAADLRLVGGAPKNLGPMEETYADYRDCMRTATGLLSSISEDLNQQIERVNPTEPRVLLERQIARHTAQISHRLRAWKQSIDMLQRAEFVRIRDLVNHRNKTFHSEALPIVARFDRGEVSYLDASNLLERMKEKMDSENAELFGPYVGALESLKESIDLEHLASFGLEELSDLRVELDRLNSLAQLGIAVEIVGHELQSYDDIIGSGLRHLPTDVRQSKAAKDIEFGYDGLTDQLRFLSPLRLAGQRIQRWMTGEEIASYLAEFFKLAFAKSNITFESTPHFDTFRVFDQQSRLFPVFINLINNSIYWVSTKPDGERRVFLDVVEDEIVVSDSGPGVDAEDVGNLFSLFFTKKLRGGRGVGLYLARANLAAGGHKIRYATNLQSMPLKGANFIISFRGAEFSDR